MDCLGTLDASSFHSEFCLPIKKPRNCPEDSWRQKNVFRGQDCPAVEPQIVGGLGGLPPAYLSVSQHEDCLGTLDASASHSEFCLPIKKPRNCPRTSWRQMKNVFQGQDCPAVEPQIVGGLGGLPPAYLSVSQHEDCLGTLNASASHSEFCLPIKKPRNCPRASWRQMNNDFRGQDCPQIVGK
jgi:hypothetical protein